QQPSNCSGRTKQARRPPLLSRGFYPWCSRTRKADGPGQARQRRYLLVHVLCSLGQAGWLPRYWTDKPASGVGPGTFHHSLALDRHQQASSKPRGFSCRELAALVGATLPQGRFPCHLFCSSLPQSGLRNVSSSFSSIHSVAFFFGLLDPALPCPALPCHRRRSPPSARHCIILGSEIPPTPPLRPPPPPLSSQGTTSPSTSDGSSSPSPLSLLSGMHMRSAVSSSLPASAHPDSAPHLGNPKTASSATGAAALWTSIAIFLF
ncbi:hypothetical protein F5883DRAFT_73113, partial [Diaporthe sp. PMI_573]